MGRKDDDHRTDADTEGALQDRPTPAGALVQGPDDQVEEAVGEGEDSETVDQHGRSEPGPEDCDDAQRQNE